MSGFDFDYFVIGGGSGGVRSARIAAQHGARVGIAEERYWGGTCVNVGCVPKKLLAMAAHFSADFEDAAGFGWTVPGATHDWATLIARKDAEIGRLNGIYRKLLTGVGATMFDARAVLVDAHTVEVGGQRVTADRILVATGGWPVLPDRPGVREHAFTSNEAFHLERMPQRVVIVGGGYIAVEFAGIFHGLGAEVTLVHRGDMVLRGFDDDLRVHLATEIGKAGVNLRLGCNVEGIAKVGDALAVTLSNDEVIAADGVMYATGRKPNSAGLGLETVGITVDADGAITVDEQYRTSVPNIYALGDVTDRLNLTPVAIAEGHALADTLFGGKPRVPSYENVPTAVFSNPPIGTVGLTEAAARQRHGEVDVYRAVFRPMRHTLSGREERTLMKLVVDPKTDRVLGCHMVGPDAPEIVQGLGIALTCGATKAQFDATIGIHPTAAEEFVTMRSKVERPASPGLAQ